MQYEAFSPALTLCIQLNIEPDGLVENTETFAIMLDVSCSTEDEQNEFEGRLIIGRSSTQVTITDTSELYWFNSINCIHPTGNRLAIKSLGPIKKTA